MKTTIQLAIVGIIMLTACKKNQHGVNQCLEPTNASASSSLRTNPTAPMAIELVYYDSMLVKMKLEQFRDKPSESLLTHKRDLNILYMSNGFITVANAIQGDGYNAIWNAVEIGFVAGVTPRQFYSEAEILAAAAGKNPEILLSSSTKIYRGAIIDHTHTQ